MPSSHLLTAASYIRDTNTLSPQTLKEWYRTVHVPDLIAVPGVNTATFLECTNSTVERPWLAVYELDSPSVLETQAFKDIPATRPDMFEGMINDLVDFGVDIWEAHGACGVDSVGEGEMMVMVRYKDDDGRGVQEVISGLKQIGARNWKQCRSLDGTKVSEMYLLNGNDKQESIASRVGKGGGQIEVSMYKVIKHAQS
jgi:hypothetical protein